MYVHLLEDGALKATQETLGASGLAAERILSPLEKERMDLCPPELNTILDIDASEPCPDCDCCTARLCLQAHVDGAHCLTLVPREDKVTVQFCPCSAARTYPCCSVHCIPDEETGPEPHVHLAPCAGVPPLGFTAAHSPCAYEEGARR